MKKRIIGASLLLGGVGAMSIGLLPQPGLLAAQVRGNTVDVSDGAALANAVMGARPGSTIRLAAGEYPRLVIRREIERLPIRSTGPGEARIAQAVFLKAGRWRIDGVTMLGGAGNVAPLEISSSHDILVSDVLLTGATPDPGPRDEESNGILIRSSENIVLALSEVRHVKQIGALRDSFGIIVEGNHFLNAREGLMTRATHGLIIRHNLFQGWKPRYDKLEHPDMIQFITQHVPTGSSMVTIESNYLSAGWDRAIQGIFIRAEGYDSGKFPMGFHRNFVIKNNVYYGSSRHGITMSNIRGLLAENNTVIASPHAFAGVTPRDPEGKSSGGLVPSIFSSESSWGTITNNITALLAIRVEAAGTRDINNFVYRPRDFKDARNPGRSFMAALTAGDLPVSAFAVRPDSDAGRNNRGADVRLVGPDAARRDLEALAKEAVSLTAAARLQDLAAVPPPPQ